MKELREIGLYGRGLIEVNTLNLVQRYNRCLQDIGLTTTKLKKFRVDGWGWSPEIAEEQGTPYYLSHNPADAFAIIVSPDQQNKPIYFPHHSFDRRLMRHVFDSAYPQIVNLTMQTALWLDIDTAVQRYLGPEDLLMVDSISIEGHTSDKIMTAAKKQRDLVHQIKEINTAWDNATLRKEIIESAKEYGDLRHKNLVIPTLAYNDVVNFYSRLFGGVFIFREVAGIPYLIIVEDKEKSLHVDTQKDTTFYLRDTSLPEVLFKRGLIEIDLEWCKNHRKYLRHLMACVTVDAISEDFPEVVFDELHAGQRKQYIAELKEQKRLPSPYHEIQRFVRKLGESASDPEVKLSMESRLAIARPNKKLKEAAQDVVWMLLAKLNKIDPLRLYTHDKEEFFKTYTLWSRGKQTWAANMINSLYKPIMDQ